VNFTPLVASASSSGRGLLMAGVIELVGKDTSKKIRPKRYVQKVRPSGGLFKTLRASGNRAFRRAVALFACVQTGELGAIHYAVF
jgi:hypothetical protein